MKPKVSVADMPVDGRDGTFSIGQELFPEFEALRRGHVHVQDDLVRIAHPDPKYVETALTAAREVARELEGLSLESLRAWEIRYARFLPTPLR